MASQYYSVLLKLVYVEKRKKIYRTSFEKEKKIQYPHIYVIHFLNEKDFIWIHYNYLDQKNQNNKRDYLVLPKYIYTSEQLDFIVNTLLKQLSSKRD